MFATAEMIRQWNGNGRAYFPKFATKAELDSAVAANGGQLLGPAVSVAGVLWVWNGSRYTTGRGNRIQPGGAISRQLGGAGANWSGIGSFVIQQPAQGRYTGVVPLFFNLDTAATRAFTLAYVASSPTDANDGSALTWTAAPVAGVQGATIPAATGSGADRAPGMVVGDAISLASVARTDIPTARPLILGRVLFPSGDYTMAWGTGKLLAHSGLTGLEYKARASATDYVTNPASYWQPIAQAGAGSQVAMGFKFLYVDPCIDIASVGDSTMSGTGSSSDYYSAVDVAAKLARDNSAGFIIEPAKWAIGSQTNAGMMRNQRALIASGIRPRLVLIPTWSVNDGQTAAAFALGLSSALTIAAEWAAVGATPILCTAPPNNGITGGSIALWTAHNQTVRGMAGQYLVWDRALALEDPTDPAHYIPAFTSDGVHGNDPGYAAEGLPLFNLIRNNCA